MSDPLDHGDPDDPDDREDRDRGEGSFEPLDLREEDVRADLEDLGGMRGSSASRA